jgi:hypothetical protein
MGFLPQHGLKSNLLNRLPAEFGRKRCPFWAGKLKIVKLPGFRRL